MLFCAMPTKKELPKNPSFELQRDLLIHPESNPTKYVAFEDAATHRFVPGATAWSRVNAWWLADSAWIAYNHDANAVRDALRTRAQMDSCEPFSGSGTVCYLATCASFAIVTFRGTQPDDWKDIFSDILLKAKPWDVGHAHQGFGKALEPIWKPLEAALNLLKDRPVWFTGHSLGGALATLAAFRRRQHPGGVYTFGSPRVGNGVFAGNFDGAYLERSVRYVNDHDAVTHVPSEIVAFPHGRYTHISHLRWINKDGQVGTSEPTVKHFIQDIFGNSRVFLDIVNLSQQNVQITMPDALIDHTPLYYALHTWNDFAVNG
jgi:pimeloyl-ACP methyl ester carboxylesterase